MSNMSSADDVLEMFVRTPAQELAQVNSAALDAVFCQIKNAVHHADLDTRLVAERLSVSEAEARDILDGQADLTLSDLELLLIVVRGRLKVEVEPFIATSRVQPRAAQDWRPVPLRTPAEEGGVRPWLSPAGV